MDGMIDKYLPIIKEMAATIRREHGLSESTVIGDYIFSILQDDCLVLQSKEEDQPDLDGFSTAKVIDGREVNVVYINTAKNTEKQNFCAAHELGHQSGLERQIRDHYCDDILTSNIVENIMNRFAAELMMPEADFRKQSRGYIKRYLKNRKDRKVLSARDAICIVILLMDFYFMPYKAVVYRLRELFIFSEEACKFLERMDMENREIVNKQIDLMGITRLRSATNKCQVSEPINDIEKCLKDPEIIKYLSADERVKYCRELGIDTHEEEILKELQDLDNQKVALAQKNRRA